jgi:phosphoribosylformimino-5-aminoimidazole carboxamide ribonucleotide (ProFAR) isomerase
LLEEIAAAVGRERLIIALDSKNGEVVVKGWRESTGAAAEEMIAELEPYCSGFLCTYIDKEGMLQGTDMDWFRRLRTKTNLELTAAGGISTLEEIRELRKLGIHAALGMAIYTGRLDLRELAALAR